MRAFAMGADVGTMDPVIVLANEWLAGNYTT